MLKLVLTFVALLALAATSFALSYAHLGTLGLVVAMAIAVVKAGLVVAIFMELMHARATSVVAFGTALAFVTLLVGMTIAEKLTRAPPPLAPALAAPAAPPDLSPPT